MYPSIAIANYFLDLAKSEDQYLTPLKLQKLVFIAHGWHLALHEEPLISERVEAWRWGPVISPVYHEFKYYGNTPITGRGTMIRRMSQDPRDIIEDIPEVDTDDKDTKKFLDEVWEVYGGYTGIQLANLTHTKKSPWHQVWYKKNKGAQDKAVIDDAIIQHYYTNSPNE